MMAIRWQSSLRGEQGMQQVPLPSEHQGLRDALRAAYRARSLDLPEEFRRLLARLR